MTDTLGLLQPSVSHDSRVLYGAGLLGRERRSNWVYYRAVPRALDGLLQALGGEPEVPLCVSPGRCSTTSPKCHASFVLARLFGVHLPGPPYVAHLPHTYTALQPDTVAQEQHFGTHLLWGRGGDNAGVSTVGQIDQLLFEAGGSPLLAVERTHLFASVSLGLQGT